MVHARNTTDLMSPFGRKESHDRTEIVLMRREKERELNHLMRRQPSETKAYMRVPIEKERSGLLRQIARIGSSDHLQAKLIARAGTTEAVAPEKVNLLRDEEGYRQYLRKESKDKLVSERIGQLREIQKVDPERFQQQIR